MKPATLRRHLKPLSNITMEEGARGGHYYSVDGGTKYPSATTILKAVSGVGGLIIWHDNLAKQYLRELNRPLTMEDVELALQRSDTVRDAAADLGTRMHAAMERITAVWEQGPDAVNDEVKSQTDDIMEHVARAVAWLRHNEYTPVAAETRVLLESHGVRNTGLVNQHPSYGGTVDMIALDEDGHIIVIDWKTGKSKNDTHLMQLAAYGIALPVLVQECHVVYTLRKSKDADEGPVESDGIAELGISKYYDKFCMVASAYHATRKTSEVFSDG